MPEYLPPVEQVFTADVDNYLAQLQLAIDITNNFKDSVTEAITEVAALATAINGLESKEIKITVDKDIIETVKTVQTTSEVVSRSVSGTVSDITDVAGTVRDTTEALRGETTALSDLGATTATVN